MNVKARANSLDFYVSGCEHKLEKIAVKAVCRGKLTKHGLS